MSPNMKIYVASPFFDEYEISVLNSVIKLIEHCGYRTYVPMRDGIVVKKDSPVSILDSAFLDNCHNMESADAMVSILVDQNYDPGTVWEMGYFYRANKPVVMFSASGKTNLMLCRSCIAWVMTLEDLGIVLEELKAMHNPLSSWMETVARLKVKYGFNGDTF